MLKLNKEKIRRSLYACAANAIICAVTGEGWRPATKAGRIVQQGSPGRKMLALTFDDGPSPDNTPALLDLLRQHQAKATFFVTGRNVQAQPELTRRIWTEGHQLGNHTLDHVRLSGKPTGYIREQIEATDILLRHAGYQGPIPFRAPHGRGLYHLPLVLRAMGRPHLLWSVSAGDWLARTPEQMLAIVTRDVTDGGIILLHDGGGDRSATLALVRLVLEQYQPQGYRFVTAKELLG